MTSFYIGRLYSSVYVDACSLLNDASSKIAGHVLELWALELRCYGATLQPTLSDDVTHVLIATRYENILWFK